MSKTFDAYDGELLDLGQLQVSAAWTPYPGALALASKLRESHPGGIDVILIGALKVPGYRIAVGLNGGTAVLIGLLRPVAPYIAGPESQSLKRSLNASGGMGIVMLNRSVRPIHGTPLGVMNKNCQEFEAFKTVSGLEFESE